MFTKELLLQLISYGMIFIMLVYILITILKRNEIKKWGKRLGLLFGIGLALCIIVAYRDQYDQSVLALTDPSITPGVILADGLQSYLCMIIGSINFLILFTSLIIKRQSYRKVMFYTLSLMIIVKLLIIESSILYGLL